MAHSTVQRAIWMHVLPEHGRASDRFERNTIVAVPLLLPTGNNVTPSGILGLCKAWKVGASPGAVVRQVNHKGGHTVSFRHQVVPVVMKCEVSVVTVALRLQRLQACILPTPALEMYGPLFDPPHDGVAVDEGRLRNTRARVDV